MLIRPRDWFVIAAFGAICWLAVIGLVEVVRWVVL